MVLYGVPLGRCKDEEGMKYIDVLADGRFVQELLDNNLEWVGSSNQRVINVQESLKTGNVVLHEKVSAVNPVTYDVNTGCC